MTQGIDIAMDTLSAQQRYKLLCAIVIPRPIALVTTLGRDGVTNAAPFSFFNVFSETPPLVILGLQAKPDDTPKDTTRNIRRTGEFVVNLVDEAMAESMNVCAGDFPSDTSEIGPAGLNLSPSAKVAPARITEAPFALECRRHTMLSFGPERDLLVGEVLQVHAREGLLDAGTLHVDIERYRPLGRLFADLYARQRDIITLKRQHPGKS
ncbi:flavin reductase family protein [Aurantimonas aggregata]|uniref:Flavin reductase family protein n=1 Tax=Aurantimonas aggregata TaxID=2047720 RepID=A0A6L9MIG1_9HYPH|nr:flavin reductase family protein [Aurantimonas aggregata]NDV87654.1 flavin reductase family protein [Aurantimonas aggregata]